MQNHLMVGGVHLVLPLRNNRDFRRANHRFSLVSLALATLFLASFVGSALHNHVGAADHGCVVCHVSHMPAVASAPRLPLHRVVVITFARLVPAQTSSLDPVTHQTSPRAPPA